MPWPFNHFRKSRASAESSIEALYGMIVAQAREPLFYRNLGVPDTVDGRFDFLLIHLWMVLRRLREAGAMEPAQALFDRFCEDMDDNLREMGVGDLAVPRRMQAFGEAFYGRARAYDLAFGGGVEPLAQAICKNILNGRGLEQAGRLAAYALATITSLAACDAEAILGGGWSFPLPAAEGIRA